MKKIFLLHKKSPALTLQDSSCVKRLLAWSEYNKKAPSVKRGMAKDKPPMEENFFCGSLPLGGAFNCLLIFCRFVVSTRHRG
jgi:hypothetical protein